MAAYANDPLLAFRHALAASVQPIITTSPTPASENTTGDLSIATHLHFPAPVSQTYPLSTPTRFVSAAAGAQTPIDLRSIYFAWLKRDVAIPEYIAEAQQINEALAVNGTTDTTEQPATAKSHKPAAVVNLVFVERLSLITWLEGLSEEAEKEYIKPLGPAPGVSAPSASLDAAHHVTDGGGAGTAGTGADAAARDAGPVDGKTAKAIDPALQVIYDGERKMGDRNSVLRGVRPTDFSHIRKISETFLSRNKRQSQQMPSSKPGSRPSQSMVSSVHKSRGGSASSRHAYPIILVSPSASSLLRMTNIKTFLESGVYVPPDHPTFAMHTASNLLNIQRDISTADPDQVPTKLGGTGAGSSEGGGGGGGGSNANSKHPTHPHSTRRPFRFILVDSVTDFKPDYWNRVVAVFTTGQTWQFRSYKWSNPPELFKHAPGIYIGWQGEEPPEQVKTWGRGVKSFAIDRWDEKAAQGVVESGENVAVLSGSGPRWRDRGVVEGIWNVIEESMRAKGLGPTAR